MNLAARSGVLLALVCLGSVAVGCPMEDEAKREAPAPSSTSTAAGKHGVEIVHAGPGDVATIVAAEVARAAAAHRKVIVDVGATWCEPCQRFKAAAENGELDASFADLTIVEFSLPDDEQRLKDAGYASHYIPLFAVPAPDGRASGKQIEGSIKGPQAVQQISPRLRDLLSQS
jgi:thiol-disulfide isomerase/thioredoxin